jgi:hypothetical protein
MITMAQGKQLSGRHRTTVIRTHGIQVHSSSSTIYDEFKNGAEIKAYRNCTGTHEVRIAHEAVISKGLVRNRFNKPKCPPEIGRI